MNDLKKLYKVFVTDGVNLRREANLNSKTEDGKNNIIFSMTLNTLVIRESDEVRTSGGYDWYNVRPVYELDVNKIGWAASKLLEFVGQFYYGGPPVASPAGAPPPPTYTFQFSGITYSITKPHLDAAQPTFIFASQKLNSEQITISGKNYYTTQKNIDDMKDPTRKLINLIT